MITEALWRSNRSPVENSNIPPAETTRLGSARRVLEDSKQAVREVLGNPGAEAHEVITITEEIQGTRRMLR